MSEMVRSIYAALNQVIDPCAVSAGASLSLCEMGLVDDVQVAPDGVVTIALRLTSPGCLMGGFFFEPEIVKRVSAIEGVASVVIRFGDPLGWSEAHISEAGRHKLEAARRRPRLAGTGDRHNTSTPEEAKRGSA